MKTKIIGSIVAILLMASVATLFAGGPLIIFDEFTRTPYAYPVGPVSVYTDIGANGLLTNAESDGHTVNGYAEWTAVPTSYFSAAVVGDFSSISLPDIDGFNAGLVEGTFNGGGIHVMYDDDGSIVSWYFGAPPGVLGIASPEWATTGTSDLLESWVVVNGSAADPLDTGGTTYAGVFTHEFGHTINLAHTQTNGACGFFGDGRGPDFCGHPYSGTMTVDDFETMYPYLDITPGSTGQYQAIVDHLDDIASISNVYPTAGWPNNHGTITGYVYDVNGSTELTGINVIARNVADPFKGAVSALTGDYTQGYLGADGLFTLNGLVPGADYVLYIDEIVAGGFSTTPGTITGDGDEEYWNASEHADPGIDDPCDYTLITAVAGSPISADIIVNGDPSNLNLGDDDYVEVALPFSFPFCGMTFNSVFVGSNGFLTFGSGSTDYSESVAELMSGPPRIAPLWDDLNPTAGGTIIAEEVGSDFVVSYNNIPEYYSTGSNSFAVTLRSDGSFDIDYGTITAGDGLVGRTPGGGDADPGEIDLSVEPQPIGALMPTVYENFSGYDNDLDGASLAFAPCVYPDPPEIVVDPTSLSALLVPGESVIKNLTISNLGDLDLNWAIVTSEGSGSPAQGGIIPKLDQGGNGDPLVSDEARLTKMENDNAGSSSDKPEHSPYKIELPYPYALSILSEDFNSGFPTGWTVVNNIDNGVEWQVPQQGEGNYTGGTGDAAGASSDYWGSDAFDTELRTPPITGFGINVVLSYVVNYQNYVNYDILDLDISTDGGSNWTTVLSWNEDHPVGGLWSPPGEQVALNLDAFLTGATEFMVRWRYYDTDSGAWDWYVQVDDVTIVSDESLTPCGYITAVDPNAGTIPGDGDTDVDVTFDATGYTPGTYDCELIINSNAFNEPRLVVPLQMIVAHDAAFDIKPGSCPNPFNAKLFEWAHGMKPKKGGVLPVALVGDVDFDVTEVDQTTISLHGVTPLDKGMGYEDVATPNDNDDCECLEADGDGITDLVMKFKSQEVALAIMTGPHRGEVTLTLMGQLVDGTTFLAKDCIKFVGDGNEEPEPETTEASNELGDASPNPFNPMTRISYSLADPGLVELYIYDVSGKLVERLVNGQRDAGDHVVEWNARGLASGIYFYRLTSGQFSQTRKMVLLK